MKYCSKCGKELFDDAVMCPACGAMQNENNSKDKYQPLVEANNNQQAEKDNTNAAKILGILSIIFAILVGLPGIVLGIIGLVIDKQKKYKNLCIAGIVIGAISVVLMTILRILNVILTA